jgi:hypothetical protein
MRDEKPDPNNQPTLSDLARRLRDLVNRVRRHERLWRGRKRDWYVITSGLDMVQDTAWALETYAVEVDDLDDDKPHAYVRIFGVLNGLVIQQDSAFLLFKAVGAPKAALEFANSGKWAFSIPALANARQIRVTGAGQRATRLLGGPRDAIVGPLPESEGSVDGAAAARARARPDPGPFWVPAAAGPAPA